MTSARHPSVSVVVCTRDRAARLRVTLESLAGVRVPTDLEWEVVVVDNDSTDGTVEVVEVFRDRLPLRHVRETVPGLSHARNRGVLSADGDFLIWVDDDVDVPPGWLEAWVTGFRDFPEADFYGSDIAVRFDVDPPGWVLAGWERLGSLFAERRTPGHGQEVSADYLPFGANYAVRAEVQRGSRYDPTLGRAGDGLAGGEETTLLLGWLQAGRVGRWIEGAGLVHRLGPERYELPRLRRQIRSGACLLQPEPRATVDGPPMSTWAIRRQWIRAEIRWRVYRWLGSPERWVDAFVAAASWRGRLDRREGRRVS